MLHLLAHRLAHRHRILRALGNQLPFTLWSLPHHRAEGGFPAPDGFQGGVELALGQLHLRQWAQVKITRGGKPGSRLPRRHLAVTDISYPASDTTHLHPTNPETSGS